MKLTLISVPTVATVVLTLFLTFFVLVFAFLLLFEQLLLLLLVFLLLDCFLQLMEEFRCSFIELFSFAMALSLLYGWDESHLLASNRVHALVSEVP